MVRDINHARCLYKINSITSRREIYILIAEIHFWRIRTFLSTASVLAACIDGFWQSLHSLWRNFYMMHIHLKPTAIMPRISMASCGHLSLIWCGSARASVIIYEGYAPQKRAVAATGGIKLELCINKVCWVNTWDGCSNRKYLVGLESRRRRRRRRHAIEECTWRAKHHSADHSVASWYLHGHFGTRSGILEATEHGTYFHLLLLASILFLFPSASPINFTIRCDGRDPKNGVRLNC